MDAAESLTLAASSLQSDLEHTGRWSERSRDALAAALAGRREWVAAWPQGADFVPGLVAQDLQESLHADVDRDWPTCPEHGDHALFIEPDLGADPFWVCEVSGLPVAPIGGL